MKYQLVIFDLDGTILDTLEDLKNSVNYALKLNELPERSLEEVRRFVGNGIRKLIERAVPENTKEDLVDQVFETFKVHYQKHCADATKPYDGIVQLLEVLRKEGCKTAVVSNKADVAVKPLCEKYFPGLFDAAVGERENILRKPAPDSVFEILRLLDVDKKHAVYIGDSDVDFETAKNAGLPCISCTWGFRDEEFLKAHGASVFAHNMEECLALLS